MLGTDQRQYLVEALEPPHGYELDEAIATTYSLDLTSLLTVPVHLALGGLASRKLGEESPVVLLEALRRTTSKLDVYVDAGHVALPTRQHLLYGLLERVIVPSRGPRGGSLHAKLWVLRYRADDGDRSPLIRLVVLSRNLTNDRSWDVSLVLEGPVGGRNVAAHRELGELVASLPDFALVPPSDAARARAARLGAELRRAQLELPRGFDDVWFHVLGTKAGPWRIERSDQLVVVSPFVKDAALRALAATSAEPVALVARGEELDELAPETLSSFGSVFTLHEQAEDEEGAEPSTSLRGLHAKVLVAKRGARTHLYVGSANATDSALLGAGSIEVMAELVGRASRVGGIDGFLGDDGIGRVLVPYRPPETPATPDAERKNAELMLERARESLLGADLRIRFTEGGDEVVPELEAQRPIVLDGVELARAWLVTVADEMSSDLASLAPGAPVALARCSVASATGLVAVELISGSPRLSIGFVLNLPTEGLPVRRNEHVIRMVIQNRDRFLAFLSALLSDLDEVGVLDLDVGSHDGGGSTARDLLGPGLLERLLRARARRPDRMQAIRETVEALCATEEGRAIVPDEFLEVWSILGGEQ